MRRNKTKKTKLLALLLILVFLISVGYAALTTNLSINGTAIVKANGWNIFFDNVQIITGSVTANPAPITSGTSTTSLTWTVSMDTPGQFYEFFVDVVNNGSIDGMIGSLSNTTLTTEQAEYLNYTVTYSDGTPIEQYDILAANTSDTLKIRLEFRTDIEPEDLPETAEQITLIYTSNYVQADIHAKSRNKKLAGATAVFVGDSITEGVGTSNGTRYWELLEESLELSSVTGMGVAGSCISAKSDYGNSNSPLINRYNSIPEADLITIFMGTNDYGHETPLGTISDTEDISFYGALNVILPSLKTKYPNSMIVAITPLHRYGFGTSDILGTAFTYDYLENGVGANLGDYVEALNQVCIKYSIPVIDLYTLSGLDPSNPETKSNYMPDGLHPNEAGHEIIANIMKNWLNSYANIFFQNINDLSNINVQLGNGYSTESEYINAENRASIVKNIYLKSGDVIGLKDNTTYKYGVYTQTSENVVAGVGILLTDGWITASYTIPSDGWYGIAFARNDDANFNFNGVDSSVLDDYLEIYNNYLKKGNGYSTESEYINAENRASIVKNIYLKSGDVIKLKDNTTYQYGVYVQTSENVVAGEGILLTDGWITASYTIPSDGWYGIAFARKDDANFDFNGVDSLVIDDYLEFLEN
ncbi:MAG: SGNH/GDSL hydrolase family protein [Clostridia bacterium]|nr:SGNH/GDSL hydrolase family protein [Clostridia bacterium]